MEIPDTVQENPADAQHFLPCDIQKCRYNCQFYCNHCHIKLCQTCRDRHQRSPGTNNHEVVPYRQRRLQPNKIHVKKIVLYVFITLILSAVYDEFNVNNTGKQKKQYREKSTVKPTLSLSSSVTKVREYTLPGFDNVYHISLPLGRFWGSDWTGNLVETDLNGNQLKKIQTNGGRGYHAVTYDGDLFYTDRDNNVINRITQDNTITELLKTGDWEPISIHSSHINGDILVGMIKDKEAKVTRYNEKGTEIQSIQMDNKGQELYSYPHYITENLSGDIFTSDLFKNAVVVVNKTGQHRFSYTGLGSGFYPYGICTDILGHILVCDGLNNTVHLLDQDGQFLSLLVTQQQGVEYPRGVCVDDESNLYVGQRNTNSITVYKYLQ